MEKEGRIQKDGCPQSISVNHGLVLGSHSIGPQGDLQRGEAILAARILESGSLDMNSSCFHLLTGPS